MKCRRWIRSLLCCESCKGTHRNREYTSSKMIRIDGVGVSENVKGMSGYAQAIQVCPCLVLSVGKL